MSILEQIHGHEDLQNLSEAQRLQLCQEIRAFLVERISQTGGHLASNLGVVELSVAIETVYNTNIDRLVFDVGHQSYVHKLLTGRRADFAALRCFGGISGFPKPSESDADAFVAGHASSSISIALGMARARTLQRQNYDVITLIGDGAATGGMVYEALNDAAVSGERMVIILNDNEMSIAPNVGGFAQHLSRIRTKESYLGMKARYRSAMAKSGFTRSVYRGTRRIKDWVKRVLLPTTIFDNMGLTYLGPVDGNNLAGMTALLRLAKGMKKPVVIHVFTQKGKGYGPAEEAPDLYHGVGPFDPAAGIVTGNASQTFSDAFGRTMVELAGKDPKLCAITAAMPGGTGLGEFLSRFPERTFDVGIAEEHAVSMAGGLAKQGMTPVVALYSTFLQRAYDQIMQDIAMLHLHVILAVDRCGLVGEDGETHHGVFDPGFLRQMPGMTVLCPASTGELSDMLTWAAEEYDGPVAIRYPRGGDRDSTGSAFAGGPVCCHRQGSDVALVTYGVLTDEVLKAAQLLAENGISASVLRLLRIDPLPVEEIAAKLGACRHVIVIEETCAGSGIKEAIAWHLPGCRVDGIDLGPAFPTHGKLAHLYANYGLDGESIAKFVQEVHPHEK